MLRRFLERFDTGSLGANFDPANLVLSGLNVYDSARALHGRIVHAQARDARRAGVKVLKFSIGFGPKIAGRQIGETEYLLSAIPLGGYVKMLGEDSGEEISEADKQRSFSHAPLYKRFAIVAAGPVFNLLLAYLIFTAWLATGAPLFVPSFADLAPISLKRFERLPADWRDRLGWIPIPEGDQAA